MKKLTKAILVATLALMAGCAIVAGEKSRACCHERRGACADARGLDS